MGIPIHRQPRDKRRGAAAVEMALVLPVFLMVVWGIIEFGRAMMVGQLVTNAARHGARLSIIDGNSTAYVTNEVESMLVNTVGGITAADVTVTVQVTPAPGNSDPGNETADANTNDLCEVSATIPYDTIGYMSGQFLSGANLRGTCVMRHE